MKFNNTLIAIVKNNLNNGQVPMLLGEVGIGKSSWIEALARVMGTKVFILACNQLAEKADLTGARLVPVVDEKGIQTGDYKQVFYPHAVVYDAVKYAEEHPGETPILFLDELNRTTADITSALLSIPTARMLGNIKMPKNLAIIIAGNDKGNIVALDEASITRFVLYHVEPDLDTFLTVNPQLNPLIVSVLKKNTNLLFCKEIAQLNSSDDDDDSDDKDVFIEDIIGEEDEMKQLTTPRTITALSNFLNGMSQSEIAALLQETRSVGGKEVSTLQEIIEGHTGKTAFSEMVLLEIINNIMTLPNKSQFITVHVPSKYDEMKQYSNRNDLMNFVSTLSDAEKSSCLIYALYEKQDNADYIAVLASQMQASTLQPSDTKLLMQMLTKQTQEGLDSENINALLNTKTEISKSLASFLSI